ncbi:unnamed protein product [Ectocarpus sp. 8 AP-2014]
MKHLSARPKRPTLKSAIQARFRALRETEKTPRQHTSVISSISRTNNAIQSLQATSGAITRCLQRGLAETPRATRPTSNTRLIRFGHVPASLSASPRFGAMSSHYLGAPQEAPGALRDALYHADTNHSGIRPLPVRNNAVGLDFITTNGAITPADRMSRAKK